MARCKIALSLLFAAIFSLALSIQAQAQNDQWNIVKDGGNVAISTPSPGDQYAVYHPGDGIVYLLDGTNIWYFNGSSWTSSAVPVPYGAVAYVDSATPANRKILVYSTQGDLWEYDGTDWTDKTADQTGDIPVVGSNHLTDAAWAYDKLHNKVVFFGGLRNLTGTASNQTYLLDPDTYAWTVQSPATVPGERFKHCVVYDYISQKVLLYGGRNVAGTVFYTETFAWNGSNWVSVNNNASQPSYNPNAFYSSARKRVVSTEVYGSNIRLWEFNGQTNAWKQIASSDIAYSSNNNHSFTSGLVDDYILILQQAAGNRTVQWIPTPNTAPDLLHVQTVYNQNVNTALSVSTDVTEKDDTLSVTVNYRNGASGAFTQLSLHASSNDGQPTDTANTYTGTIPAGVFTAGVVQYYFSAVDAEGLSSTLYDFGTTPFVVNVLPVGDLKVNLSPADAITDGAQWSIDGINYYNSGVTLSNLPVSSSYTIYFSPLSNWDAPTNLSGVTLTQNVLTTVNADPYVAHTGSLTITLSPQEAIDNGAMWKVDGGSWQVSGATVANLRVRDNPHSVQFADASDFLTPLNKSYNLTRDVETTDTATYVKDSGSVSVSIEPQEARDGGAQWSIDGTNWYASGHLLTGVPVGNYSVQYSNVSGWFKPDDENISVIKDVTTTTTGTYTKKNGTLVVNIGPQSVLSRSPQWKIKYTNTWYNPGQNLTTAIGSYVIEFKPVAGWAKPGDVDATVQQDQTTTVTALYTEDRGTVTGRVMDSFDSPLAGATVMLESLSDSYTDTKVIGQDGLFRFTNVPANRNYNVTPLKPNFRFTPRNKGVVIAVQGNYAVGNFIGVFEPTTLTITGGVYTKLGFAMPGAVLQINGGHKAVTGTDGSYRFPNLAGGSYEIEILKNAAFVTNTPKQTVNLKDKDIGLVNFRVTRSNLFLSGRVYTYDGQTPFAGVSVQITGPVNKTATTSSGGVFTFAGLQTGSYTVTALKQGVTFNIPSQKVDIAESNVSNINFVQLPTGLKELKIGKTSVYADTFTLQSPGVLLATGNIYIGSQRIIRARNALICDTTKKTMTSTDELWLEGVPRVPRTTLETGKFTFGDGEEFTANDQLAFYEYGLIRYTVKAVHINSASVEMKNVAGIYLGITKFEVEVLTTATRDKLYLHSFDATIDKIDLGGWGLSDVHVYYDAKKISFGGEGTLMTPLGAMGGLLQFVEGRLDAVGISIEADIPIWPPYLFLSSVEGGIYNLTTPLNLVLEAGAGMSAGPSVGPGGPFSWHLITVKGKMRVSLSGAFRIFGETYFLFVKMWDAEWGYEVYPRPSMDGALTLTYGTLPKLIIAGRAGIAFNPIEVWGSLSGQLKFKLKVDMGAFKVDKTYTIGGVGAGVTLDGMKFWAKVDIGPINAHLDAVLDDKGFRVTNPDALKSIKFDFKDISLSQTVSAAPGLASANQKEINVPAGTGEVYWLIGWEKGDTTPVIVAPDGRRLDGAKVDKTFDFRKDPELHLASFSVADPVPGTWKVELPGEKNLGVTLIQPSLYAPEPGVAITDVIESGDARYTINFDRTWFSDEQVSLFYGPTQDEDKLENIASAKQIGAGSSWDWDASKVPPGRYWLYIRVFDKNNHPFLARYDKAVVLHGDTSRRLDVRPRTKAVSRGLRVSWPRLDDPTLKLIRVYYTDDMKSKTYDRFVESAAGKNALIISPEQITAGRPYKIALAGIYDDDVIGEPSKAVKTIYRLKKRNNPPYFAGHPKRTAIVGKQYVGLVKGMDLDHDSMSFNLLAGPSGMRIDADGKITWMPTVENAGPNQVIVMVNDGNDGETQMKYSLNVVDPNAAGSLEVRPAFDPSGLKSYVVAYWNPARNIDESATETVDVVVSGPEGGLALPVKLIESGLNSGYFSARLSDEQIQNLLAGSRVAQAGSRTPKTAALLNTLTVKVKDSTRERTSFRANAHGSQDK